MLLAGKVNTPDADLACWAFRAWPRASSILVWDWFWCCCTACCPAASAAARLLAISSACSASRRFWVAMACST